MKEIIDEIWALKEKEYKEMVKTTLKKSSLRNTKKKIM